MRKSLAIVLTLLLIVSLIACSSKDGPTGPYGTNGTTGVTPEDDKQINSQLFDKPVTITIMAPYNASWPFQEDWYALDLIKRKTNVAISMDAVDSTGFIDKYNITMASGELPDLIFDFNAEQGNQYGPDGAFANVLEHLDKLPNFKKWADMEKEHVMSFMSAEGKLYGFPIYGIGNTNLRGWLYRKDIFDRNNLQVPTNDAEFLNVLKSLKELYPESYPLTFRENLVHFKMASTAWGIHNDAYYDWDTSTWKYGPIEDNFKEMVAYYKKLYNENLIPPDFLSLTTAQWQQILASGNAFLTLDYVVRVDFYNVPMREENPEVDWRYMVPPAFGSNGQQLLRFSAESNTIINISNTKNLDNTLKFMDWMYTDEAKDILSWGEEGTTYEVANGERKWVGKSMTTDVIRKQYGLSTNGLYTLFDYNAHSSTFSPELKEADTLAQRYSDRMIPIVALTQSEKEVDLTVGVSIRDCYRENISKFIIGDRPMDEYDLFVKEIKALGLDKYIDTISNAFKRQLGSAN